jgi:hypothetical protein
MRKPKDFDSELNSLNQRAQQLKTRKAQQLGELVLATGADMLGFETLAGALLAARGAEPGAKGVWHSAGSAFFQSSRRSRARGTEASGGSTPPSEGGALPRAGGASTN